jgi:hypothetical protein
MAEIVDKIFGLSPEEVQIANQQRTQDLNKMFLSAPTTSQRLGGVLGVALGSGLSKVFPSEDPQLNKAVAMSKIQKGLRDDYTSEELQDPNVFFPALSQRLSEGGFQNEANEATILGQKQIDDYNKNQSIIAKNIREESSVEMTALDKAKLSLSKAQSALDKDPLNPLLLQDVEDYKLAVDNLLKRGEEKELTKNQLEVQAYKTLVSDTASEEDKKKAQNLLNTFNAEKGMKYNAKEERYEWIIGSPEYKEAVIDKKNEIRSAFGKLPNNQQVIKEIKRAISLVSPLSAGASAYLKGFKGSPALELDKAIDQIKANIGFDRLQKMRTDPANKTGGALGQVAVKELDMLQATLGSLDTGQPPETLRLQLNKVLKEYNAVAARWEQQIERTTKEFKQEFPTEKFEKPIVSNDEKKPEVPLAERDDLFN